MTSILEVQSVMTPFPHVIKAEQNLQEAKEMMREHGVRHLPVTDGNKVVGVLSHRDLNFHLALEQKPADELLVENAYSDEPYEVSLTEDVADIARKMHQERIGCALVVQSGEVVGIFTTVDVCRTLAEVLTKQIGV